VRHFAFYKLSGFVDILRELVSFKECHPERGRMPESKDPENASVVQVASRHSLKGLAGRNNNSKRDVNKAKLSQKWFFGRARLQSLP
jgi:hypothetical protein